MELAYELLYFVHNVASLDWHLFGSQEINKLGTKEGTCMLCSRTTLAFHVDYIDFFLFGWSFMHTIKWRIVCLWVCVCVYKIMFRHKHPILHFQQALNTLKSRGFPSTLMSSKWLEKQILQKWLGTLLYTWAHLSLTLLLRDGQKTKRGGRKAMIKKGV